MLYFTMADQPLRERAFDTFLSHSHADKALVDRIHAWLLHAGIQVWYDATHLAPGAMIASELGEAIGQCRSAIVVMSKASVASGWVKDEWNQAAVERNRPSARGFRIIPLRLEECEVPPLLEATKWVDMAGRLDDLNAWAELLDALSEGSAELDARRPFDLYLSCSWREGREQQLVQAMLPRFAASELRLIGDSPNWPNFNGNRISTLMRSCCGVVVLIPNRPRSADRDELKYFIAEARLAARLQRPLLLLAEDGAELPSDLQRALRLSASGAAPEPQALDDELQAFLERCRRWPRSGQVFMAVDFDAAFRARNELLRRLIQRCTGLQCVVGEQIGGDAVQRSIIALIRQAVWVLADISDNPLNTCIEAGAALGADVECTLLARQPYQKPPFMLRGPELKLYQDDLDLLAIVHRSAREHRRRVVAIPG